MSFLKEIHEYKLKFVNEKKASKSLAQLIKECNNLKSNKVNKFSKKLFSEKNKKISIIGELKRSSPSAGIIANNNIDLINIAKIYEDNNISCLSILTDEKYFKGNNIDLIRISQNINIPILRKDFIVDEYQIYESMIIGADCILLILAILSDDQALLFEKVAHQIGLDVLIEVHDENEMNRAQKMNSQLIGINNRNLNDFSVDVNNSINISQNVNENKLIIAESGINNKKDIQKIMSNSKIDTFLIGESLMRSKDLSKSIRNLIS